MSLTFVVAADESNVIGRDGDLPWRLPNDLRHFKAVTMGAAILMGRKTYESIGRPLPGRRNLVLTRNAEWQAPGVHPVADVNQAMAQLTDGQELMVVGGGEIYRALWPLASRIELTRVHATVEGDTRFPEFAAPEWVQTHSESHDVDDQHAVAYTFETWERAGTN